MAIQKTTAELLQESIEKLGPSTPLLTKPEHKLLVDNLINSLLNKDTDKLLLSLFQHDPERAYAQGEGVLKNQQLWQAINNITASTPFDPNLWTQITGQTALSDYNFDEWDPDHLGGAGYSQDDKVTRDDRLWNSDSDSNTQDPLVGGWTEISANDGNFGNRWVVGVYKLNQVVTNPTDNILYILDPSTIEPFSSVDIDAEIIAGDWVVFHDLPLQGFENVLVVDNKTGSNPIDHNIGIGKIRQIGTGDIEEHILFGDRYILSSDGLGADLSKAWFDLGPFNIGRGFGGVGNFFDSINSSLYGIFKTKASGEDEVVKINAGTGIQFLYNVIIGHTAGSESQTAFPKIEYSETPPLNDILDLPHRGYVDNNVRSNYVLVDSLSKLPAPSGGKHVLAPNITYEWNGTITSSDYIEVGTSNIIIGKDKSNDIFVYTGTGAAIRGVNNDFSLLRVGIVAASVGALAFTFSGDSTNNIEITNCIFSGCDKIGNITGGIANISFRHNFCTACEDGLTSTGTSDGVSVSDNVFEASPGGAATWIDIPSGTYVQIDITHNSFGVGVGDTGINIVEASVTRTIALIQQNLVVGAGSGLTGINANDQGMVIPANSNKGIAGLFKDGKTIVLGSWVSTITTFVQIPETLILDAPADHEDDATTFKASLVFSASHDDTSGTMETEIYNLTDGAAVAGSQKTTTVTTGGVFQKDETPEVTLLANKDYRVRFRKISGAGGASVFIRAGSIEFKAF